MTIFQIISKEAWWRIFYSLIALCSCTLFNLWKISSWVLLICLPITQLESQAQFIFTDISEAFGSACFLAFIVNLKCLPIPTYPRSLSLKKAAHKRTAFKEIKIRKELRKPSLKQREQSLQLKRSLK